MIAHLFLVLESRSAATAITNETVAAETYAPVKVIPARFLAASLTADHELLPPVGWNAPQHLPHVRLLPTQPQLTPSGIFTFQLIRYWSSHNNDKRWIKGVVMFVAGMAYGNFSESSLMC